MLQFLLLQFSCEVLSSLCPYTAIFSIYESLWFAERDERLASYALIARAAADMTVPFLVRLFSERFSLLSQVIKLVFDSFNLL